MRDYMSVSWERVTSHLVIAASSHKRLRPGLLGFFHTNARPLQSFDSSFNETCNSQMQWKVPCPVLRNKLRVSIWEHVILAYRLYLETLKQSAVSAAEDSEWGLQSKINELFEG
uniref:Exocyst subunit Exo70 family protein n=1 Tax=Arundo donax TaxID=35708 RepID=A0A0A9HJ46_ARUDO